MIRLAIRNQRWIHPRLTHGRQLQKQKAAKHGYDKQAMADFTVMVGKLICMSEIY
jgi:hypothetical protein